jgi:hypothetical protein
MEVYKQLVKKLKRLKSAFEFKNYTYEVKRMIKKYGNKPITKIEIGKMLLPYYVTNGLNIISLGQFNKNMPNNIFHFFLKLTIGNAEIVLEKNEFIIIKKWKNKKNIEYKNINLCKPIKLKKILHDVALRMQHNYFTFNTQTNNCQNFIIHVLQSLNVYTQDIQTFVKQDLQKLYYNMPITEVIANFVLFYKMILYIIVYL